MASKNDPKLTIDELGTLLLGALNTMRAYGDEVEFLDRDLYWTLLSDARYKFTRELSGEDLGVGSLADDIETLQLILGGGDKSDCARGSQLFPVTEFYKLAAILTAFADQHTD